MYVSVFILILVSKGLWRDEQMEGFDCKLYNVVSHWCYCINKWDPIIWSPKNLTDISYLMAILSIND